MSVIKKYQQTKKGQDKYISLIDDKKKYDNIKEIYTLQSLKNDKRNNTLVKNYNTLFNLFKNEYDVDISRNNLNWIDKYYSSFIELVTKHYGKEDINNNTASTYFNSAAKLLLTVNKSRFREYTRDLFLLSKQYKQKAGDTITEKEYISYEKLKIIADETIKRFKETNKYSDMIDALIMAINIYMPPLRHDITDLEISNDIKPLMTDNKNIIEQNYLWIDGLKVKIVINTDKVANKSAFRGKPFIIDFNMPDIKYNDIQITKYKLIKDLILYSLKIYPRFYLLTPENRYNEPLSNITYLNKLKKLTRNKDMSQNVFRRSFISHFYPRVSKNIQKEISHNMRHDSATARAEYQKMDIKADNDINIIPIECKPSNISADKAGHKLKYYLDNKDLVLKRKLLAYLNNNGGTPQQRTIDKYNIKLVSNKWT
jgi:hypothetical protein